MDKFLAIFFVFLFVQEASADQFDYSSYCQIKDPLASKISNVIYWEDYRTGQFTFVAQDGNSLTSYYYFPSNYSDYSPIIFVMHGAGRDAYSYLEKFAPVAERFGAFLIAPEFSYNDYPNSEDYNFGVGITSTPHTGVYSPSQWKSPNQYGYSEIEHSFESVKKILNNKTCGYFILGHSAGGQFVHRLMTFLPDARVYGAAAINSGWYTLPDTGGGNNVNYYMPYGLQGSPVNNDSIGRSFKKNLSLLVGEFDTKTVDEDKYLRGTEEAMYQGETRNSRAKFYFQIAKEKAKSLTTDFNWSFAQVPDASHSFSETLQSAVWYLAHSNEISPCKADSYLSATQLTINEIHADPVSDISGDANNDGFRDSGDDEFIEIINLGDNAICLAGWSITDSSNKKRHVFPIGTSLAKGQTIVIFGGGVPRGNFGGAIVQWAGHGGLLSLTNSGDVLSILDDNDQLAMQISWGDCGGETCASEHINFSLSINQSVVRWPELNGSWVEHNSVSNQLFSPGTRVDGSVW